jgi:hypothetical protein
MTFSRVSLAASGLFFVLFISLVIVPGSLMGPWGVEVTPEASFVGRRLASAFLGVSVLCYFGRGVSETAARRAIALALIAMLVTVAGFGIIELVRGFAAPGILSAVAVELLFAALFYRVLPRAAA